MAATPIEIAGLMPSPRRAADDSVDVGRFTLYDVHTNRNGPDVFLTSVLTAAQIATASETRLLWTAQNVQRGIHPHLDPQPVALLPVGDGYPDTSKYAELAPSLRSNVNRVTDRLTSRNPQVVTLSTRRRVIGAFASGCTGRRRSRPRGRTTTDYRLSPAIPDAPEVGLRTSRVILEDGNRWRSGLD